MRNVNLNILKFLDSINNFLLSLANIRLEVGRREIGCWGVRVLVEIPPLPHFPTSPLPHTLHPKCPIKVGFIEIKLAKIRQD
ncbi:MAG: hypothetical protein EWV52_04605 [Microcystis panniformis Mp_MB_F_20051200_S6D]|nr:MAG: hypothetical protein EWV42_23770 [Microcystis panniformis Mp_GB_SS_20050300_S99D]TRV43583.1 MAG: hypothetical protein EWV43_20530 [Microcystis panniformis Mp_MB_F_20080800_S26D]TRV50411.1 MAG: hypothetical protein EWV87_08450 [Microcystis panniformis Mp_GB_SS_20050300_S99]TRV60815.1 MAG: hypothetical protein EWV69_09055 [Microcystis panniformis Mp_MB_F_20080800_S26]TRV66818.1 MAG: hypothetical protein EWV86_05665 [Microcystis panniformis Mp_MB_F_20051200_S9D]TRV67482.1 MAG: hypothetica